jgi:hypothetical protein
MALDIYSHVTLDMQHMRQFRQWVVFSVAFSVLRVTFRGHLGTNCSQNRCQSAETR